MRWINFFIMVLILLVVQSSIGRLFGLGPQRITPSLFLLLALVLAFRVGNSSSLIACWILGLVKDLSGGGVLGGYAIGFVLVGFLVIYFREWFYVEHSLGIMVVVLIGCVLVEQCVFAIELFKGIALSSDYRDFCVEMFFGTLFTAALAPYGQWVVAKLSRPLGVEFGKAYN